MTSKIVQEMLVEGRLERVSRNPSQAGRMLQSCLQHLETADQRARGDPSGSYALLYDAARKAVGSRATGRLAARPHLLSPR